MRSGEVANIVYSPSDPDVLYLGIEVNTHSMYKSIDGGRTWELLLIEDHAKDVAVHPTNPDVAFVTDSQKVLRTMSGGRPVRPPSWDDPSGAFDRVLWSPYPPGPSETSFSSIAVARSNPEVVYTAIKGSNRSGDRDTPAQLYRSTDGGASFDEVGGRISTFNVLLVDPGDDRLIFAGAVDGVYISRDGGESFSQAVSSRDVADLDSVDGETILAATGEGILLSSDGGNSWGLHSEGLPSTTTLRVRIARSSPNVVWATTDGGAAKSTNGGKTWKDVSSADSNSGLPGRNLQALAVHPENSDIALVATETFNFSVRSDYLFKFGQYYAQGIFRTEDGGKTWGRSDAGIFEYVLEDITAHLTRPSEVWAGQQASRGLYRSRDAGQTWSLTPSLLTHYPMRLVFFPDDPNKAASTSSHSGEAFGITYDSGVNWEVSSERTFHDSLATGISLYDSEQREGNLHLHGLAIDPSNPQVIYVGSHHDPSEFSTKPLSGSHIFKSTDGGNTWIEWDNDYPHAVETSIHEIRIDPQDSRVVYLGTTELESVTGNGIWKSTDAGGSWFRANNGMPNNISISVILIHPKRPELLLASTEEGIYRSTDAGSNWNQVATGTTRDMEYELTDADVVYAGKEDGLFLSKDFGLNWQDISGNLPVGLVTALAVNCNGTVVYASVSSDDRRGYGLFASIAGSVPEVDVDTTTGIEFGQAPRGRGLDSGRESGPGPGELQCMIEALGEDTVKEIGSGREPSSNEVEKFKHCIL